MLYDFNCHPDTPRDEMLTVFDLLPLLTFDHEESQGEVAAFRSLFFRRGFEFQAQGLVPVPAGLAR